MLKQLLLLGGAALFSFGLWSCEDETPDPTPTAKFSATKLNPTATGKATNLEISAYSHIKNLTNGALNLTWRRVEPNLPSVWATTVCTNGTCFSATTETQTMMIPANDSSEVKVNFMPMGAYGTDPATTGTGSVRILVFDPADSANTVVNVRFEATATP